MRPLVFEPRQAAVDCTVLTPTPPAVYTGVAGAGIIAVGYRFNWISVV